jgi:3-hydroxyisobutyrate dehydrogenase-like beta-hydroxyacid dehydrogenase
MTSVGWVGLGEMGLPRAGCVARAGNETTAYDIDPGRAASVAAYGAFIWLPAVGLFTGHRG